MTVGRAAGIHKAEHILVAEKIHYSYRQVDINFAGELTLK
jgi:hypothetical protein